MEKEPNKSDLVEASTAGAAFTTRPGVAGPSGLISQTHHDQDECSVQRKKRSIDEDFMEDVETAAKIRKIMQEDFMASRFTDPGEASSASITIGSGVAGPSGLTNQTDHDQAWNFFPSLQNLPFDGDQGSNKTNLPADLRTIAANKGFVVIDNQANGNCLFYALSEQLRSIKGIQISHKELRKTLVQFLLENPNLHNGTPLLNFVSEYSSWREYLQSMAKDGTWGDHLVLFAAANYFQTPIRIISSLNREIGVQPDHAVSDTSPLVLGHIHDLHFVSLQPRRDFPYPTDIVENIRLLYRRLEQRILPVPWCKDFSFHINDIFTRLKIVGKEKTRGALTHDITNMTAIFKTNADCQRPRTVLIEGDPGVGKTTYCQKLAYDWATKQGDWDPSFPEIEVLLLLKGHEIKSDIWKAIDDQVLPVDIDDQARESFFKFIRENQSKVLLVLDGLDEVYTAYKEPRDLVEGKVLPACHVVFTARGVKFRRYCDSVWQIVGFTDIDAERFIRAYFKNRKHLAENLIKKVWDSESVDFHNLITNPSHAAFLCVICEDLEGVFPNKTHLYIDIVNCVLRRYEHKQGLSSENENLLTSYKGDLLHLGRVALQSLQKGELYFEEHRFDTSLFFLSKFGFLSIHPGKSRRMDTLRYGFLHKGFQEFFSGLYLAWQIIDGNVDCDAVVTDQRYWNELNQVRIFMTEFLALETREFPETVAKEWLPSYVLARGPRAVAAFIKAKASGETLDKRVKVLLIGQDRVGKTSVKRSLLGETFRGNEISTDGVQMHEPLKNPVNQPWKNYVLQHETTAYHHKCAELISKGVQPKSTESQESSNLNVTAGNSQKDSPSGLSNLTKQDTGEEEFQGGSNAKSFTDTNEQEDSQSKLTNLSTLDTNDDAVTASLNSTPDNKQKIESNSSNERVLVDDKIVDLTVEELDRKKTDTPDGIWPVIWDFAGQALFRAIHPIFMSSEAVYVLVWDLTRDLFAKAQCKVNEDGREEVEVLAADSNDTNLDHILRWLDMVHSLRPEGNPELPPVILVGTHADEADFPDEKREKLERLLRKNFPAFSKHIVKSVVVDNTLAGGLIQEEDGQIVEVRETILEEAKKLPHTQNKVPLKWLEVENKVCEHMKEGEEKYMTKQRFKREVVDKTCQPDLENNLAEHILNFMHDRGTIVYLDNPKNANGLVVLDPQWLVNDVLCKIITVKQQKGDKQEIKLYREDLEEKGILNAALLNYACKNLNLDGIKKDLIHIMKKFNLLCEYKKDTTGETEYLVPCMLTRKPEEHLACSTSPGCEPVFITFGTNYVPFGLFSRILILFSKWAASRTSCEQPRLFANAARFVITKKTCLSVGFVCYKRVIKVLIWARTHLNLIQIEQEVLLEVFSLLKQILERLKQECHWLRGMTWKLCGQCKFCLETRQCSWHKKQKCSHEDCAHFVSINDEPFVCGNQSGELFAVPLIPQTWIQALANNTDDVGQPCTSCESLKRLKVKVGTPSDDELEGLSQRIPEDWKKLGRRLKIEEPRLIAFDREHHQCCEKGYNMLLFWKQKDGGFNASYQVLYDALCHELVQLKELAEEFCCE